MDLKSNNDIIIFIVFFIPGFVMMQYYGLLIARERIDFSKAFLEVASFSCINYAICSPFIIIAYFNDFENTHQNWFIVFFLLLVLIIPIFLVVIYCKIRNSKWASKLKLVDPIKSAWDFYFSKNEKNWVIVTLKNGNKIGGYYTNGSFASSYPLKDFYISELWNLKDGKFERKIERTEGILILGEEILTIEFIK